MPTPNGSHPTPHGEQTWLAPMYLQSGSHSGSPTPYTVHSQQSWLGLAASHSKSQPQLPVYPQQSQQSLVHSQPGTRPPHQGIHSSSGQVLQPAGLGANPTHQHTHSNCGLTTTEGCTQPMQGIPLKNLDLMTRGYCASGSQRTPSTYGHPFKTRIYS